MWNHRLAGWCLSCSVGPQGDGVWNRYVAGWIKPIESLTRRWNTPPEHPNTVGQTEINTSGDIDLYSLGFRTCQASRVVVGILTIKLTSPLYYPLPVLVEAIASVTRSHCI